MTSTRLNAERYAVHGEWQPKCSHIPFIGIRDDTFQTSSIQIDIADLLEKRSGHVWTAGAYRVTLKNVPGMRSKTFYGETAYSDAARYASDAASECGDWRWYPDL